MIDILKMYQEFRNSDRPDHRLAKITEIADDLEYYRVNVNREALKLVVYEMMNDSLREDDEAIKEGLFDALCGAATFYDIVEEIDWDPLANQISNIDDKYLEVVFICLGFSGKAKYLPLLETYLSHPRQDIVEDAKMAISEINHRNKQNEKKEM
ncbi:hypothetical protein [Paenibacillus hamazuiensis]|uniref:hypothetical protein n=1 Tax=Paenibacillus hamazuiensis TaxID=2936508 RepID=UPI00200CC279|nr:hypothetical protein [Paenibacillus hamazuiensis]